MTRALFALLLVLATVGPAIAQTDPAPSSAPPRATDELSPAELADRVREIFTAKCVDCHGSHLDKPGGRFGYIDDLQRVVDNPEYIDPDGELNPSQLWALIDWDEMPPPTSDIPPLTDDEKQAVRAWIEAGAPTDTAIVAAVTHPQVQPSDAGEPSDSAEKGLTEAEPRMSRTERFFRFIGRFHQATTHFPIALLISALLAELIILVRPKPLQRDRPTGLEVVVRFCITIGMLGAIVASALGWANAWFAIATGDRAVLLDQHRILGTVTALAAVGVWLNSERLARRPETSRWPLRIALLITCVLVGLAGHWGGMLVYGRDYYTW